MDDLILRPLHHGDTEAAVGLLSYLNPSTPPEILRLRLSAILTDHPHYHLFGATVSGDLVGIAGAWIATKIWCGKYLEVDNLVVHPAHRSRKAGTRLIQHLESIARKHSCEFITLDSYTSNHPSHRLYHRLGYEIWGFHFVKPLAPRPEA